MRRCEEPDCQGEAIIGWGSPPVMVCMNHFDERLKMVRRTVDQARQLFDERLESSDKIPLA